MRMIVTTAGEYRLQRAIPFVVCSDFRPYSMVAVNSLVHGPRLDRIRPYRHGDIVKSDIEERPYM
jgi:hypothetical protein